MATTPVYGWRIPDLGVVANAPDAFAKLGGDAENTLNDATQQSYTPGWTSNGTAQPSNPVVKTGRYRIQNGWCDLTIWATFGASTSGGEGLLSFSLPVAGNAAIGEQAIRCKLWCPSTGNFAGVAIIAGGASVVSPMFPVNSSSSNLNWWYSSSGAGSPLGSGVPAIAGQYSVQNGGNVLVHGRYLI